MRGIPEAQQTLPGSHELKFELSATRARAAMGFLAGRCQPDPRHPVGQVSTIYFDTPGLTLLRAKVNSDYLKSKVRLRWYDDAASGPLFGEFKAKTGGRRQKARVVVADPASRLVGHALESRRLLAALADMAELGPLPPGLVPVLELRYSRRRFVDPVTNTRIALDTDIRVVRVNRQLRSRFDPTPLRSAVLEAKGPHMEPPQFLGPLLSHGCRRAAFSKYLRCFEQTAA